MSQQQPLKEKQASIITDVWKAILNDEWMWVVVWGKPRCGKTTFKMRVAYEVYKDWDKVLQSFIFNLSGLLYKIDHGEPERIFTRNQLHNRVPLILYDDFGAHSNKAATQHDVSWDMFKGGFDVLATKVAVIMASMVDPNEPTFQIAQKYTHEVYVHTRGVYKYDEVDWQQDFRGWRARKRKTFIENNDFTEVPVDVYKQYDEMRMSLVDEVEQRIKDAMVDSQLETTLKRLQPDDIELLQLLKERGPTSYEFLRQVCKDKFNNAAIRCKARSLVIAKRVQGKTYYTYDLTDLGDEILKALAKPDLKTLKPSILVHAT